MRRSILAAPRLPRRVLFLRHFLLALAAVAAVTAAFLLPSIPQDPAYHLMADRRSWLGIPNTLNVLSNLPFLVSGLLGLRVTFTRPPRSPFFHPWERWPYAILFAGATLTMIGSSYYHLAPDNARLVWDRLPMTLGFMGLLTAMLAERVSLQLARRLLGPLLVLGLFSVAHWYWGEYHGGGDLRLYALVQFGSLLLIVLLLFLYPSKYAGSEYLFAALVAYALAKSFEVADRQIFAIGHIVSGHTLKHLAAGVGAACLVAALGARIPSAVPDQPIPTKNRTPTPALRC